MYSRIHTADLAVRLRAYAPMGAPNECWNWTRGTNKGYGVISVPGGRKRQAHVVAWELYCGQKLPEGKVVRHTCDNPLCTNPAHLLLGTHAENVADKVNRGRQAKGESHGLTTLTEVKVRQIRALYAAGQSQKHLAAAYNTTQPTVSNIVNRKTWKYVA